jgi:hypothetical protein
MSEAIPVATKVTVPVGGSPPLGTTVAVNVTASPAFDGLSEDVIDEDDVTIGSGPNTPFPVPHPEMPDAIRPSASTSAFPGSVTVAPGATISPFRAVT